MIGKKQSDKQKEAARIANSGKKSETAKRNMSKARLGKILMSNQETMESKYVEICEIETYTKRGFVKGRLKKNNK